jgi:choline kinase
MLTSKPKRFDIGDECWVGMDDQQRITQIVKDATKLNDSELEMVGISNISMNTIDNVNEYERMLNESLEMLSDNNMEDYEQLLASNKRFTSQETKYEWAEMDNVQHMEYAIDNVLSKLK